MRLLPRTLLDRVFLLFSLTLGSMLVGGLTIFLRSDFQRNIEEASDTAAMVIEVASIAVSDSAVVNDLDAIKRTLQAAVIRSPFTEARFIEVGGQSLRVPAGKAAVGYVPDRMKALVADELPDINRVITVGGRDYGVLRFAFHTDHVAAQLWGTAISALAAGVGSLIAGLALTRWLLSRWLSNLDTLGSFVDEIKAGRIDVQARATSDAPEEVRRALEQFNSATSGLRSTFTRQIDALSYSLVQHKRATDQAVIVIELDPTGAVSDVNDLFRQVSGWSLAALQSRPDIWSLEPALYAQPSATADSPLPTWLGEVACRRGDGSTLWVKRTVVPIRAEDGSLEKYICLDIDISGQKAAERTLIEEKERAEVTLHSIADGVITVDKRQRLLYANPAALRILGITAETARGSRLAEILEVQASRPISSEDAGRLAQRSQIKLADGRSAVIEMSRAPISDAQGRQTGEVLAFRDVTAEHLTRQELNKLSLAVKHAASAIVITDPQGRIEYVNPKFTQMTGFSRDEIRGQTPRFLKSGQVDPTVYDAMWETVRSGGTWRGELLNRRKDGTTFWSSVTLTVVSDSKGRPRQYVSVMEDVTDRKQAEETIHRLAYFDALTDLPNRRMFMERAVEDVKSARRGNRSLAACYLDLDGFKNVNDTLGHQVGDALLAEVARRIGSCLSPQDFLGRLGGDEFALLLHEAQLASAVSEVGQRIIELLEEAFVLDGHEVFISTSIGVSMFPHDGQDVADLLRKADMALYQAKEAGKRRLCFFTEEIESRKRERSELEQALRLAEERSELRLVYQPKIDIGTKAVIGAEALLRWHHPQRGLVRPDEFIPLAEETRLIEPIGRWVMLQACRQIRAWQAQGLDQINVAVNISPVQFRSPDLVGDIERIVTETGINPSQLEIEITESGLMEDPEGVARILDRLRAIGLTIAIDDFGTGYSSLAYLKSFPVSVLKVDRSFVRDLESDANDRGIAEAVISMARVLQVNVVAEGVETRGQLDILEAMGCQLAQGYFISRPLPAEELSAFWWRHRAQPAYTPTDVGNLA